jgi:dGTPase
MVFNYFANAPDELPEDFRRIAAQYGLRRAVCDFVSGMTDKYAMYQFSELFIPEAWQVR